MKRTIVVIICLGCKKVRKFGEWIDTPKGFIFHIEAQDIIKIYRLCDSCREDDKLRSLET